MNDSAAGALADVRVLELGSVVAGPFCGRLLADLGAEVIKVEDPARPDPLRSWGRAAYRGRKLWWPVHARNKKLVTLDLRAAAGQELFLRLVERSDVVVENFRPGTLERWDLGYDRLAEVNHGLVLARLSGFGQTGPDGQQAGYASVAEAMGGLRYITGHPGEAPPRMGISLGDSLAGMFAVQGVLAALHWRAGAGAGRGQVVDVSLLESCLALLESTLPEYDRLGLVREPAGARLPGIAPSNVFCMRHLPGRGGHRVRLPLRGRRAGAPGRRGRRPRRARRCRQPVVRRHHRHATPGRVTTLVGELRSVCPDTPVNLHFHNTRGTGLANVLAALQLGVRDFDASVGGLGGCPYAPGASGNIATEELVHMVEDMGVETGVDLDAMIEVARVAEEIVGHTLPSQVLRAGPRTRLTPT